MTHPIIDAIRERRDTVLFDTGKDLSDEQIRDLIDAATRAPTAFNLQNWRFIAVRTPEARARLRAVAWNQVKITDAPVTFFFAGQLANEQTLPDRLAPAVDAGIMPESMIEGWVAGAGSLTRISRGASGTRPSGPHRSARPRSSTPRTRWASAPDR